jgi:hypothetical protein
MPQDSDDPAGRQDVQRPIRGTIDGQAPIDLTGGQFDQRSPNDPPPGAPSLPPPSNGVPPPGGN